MLVEEAAKKVGMSTQTLRLALQQGLLPFGIATKTSNKRYTYTIFEERLEKYLKGEDYGCQTAIDRDERGCRDSNNNHSV